MRGSNHSGMTTDDEIEHWLQPGCARLPNEKDGGAGCGQKDKRDDGVEGRLVTSGVQLALGDERAEASTDSVCEVVQDGQQTL